MADKVGKSSVAKKLIKDQRVLLAIVIAIIIVVVSIINPNFIGISNIVAIFQQICVLGILTMAMSILLISGGVDLSVGNIMVLSGVVMYVVLNNGLPTAAAVVNAVNHALGSRLSHLPLTPEKILAEISGRQKQGGNR